MTEPKIRMTVVSEAPEGYVHAPVLPEIPPNPAFDGLRVVVHQLPTVVREGMARLGNSTESEDAS